MVFKILKACVSLKLRPSTIKHFKDEFSVFQTERIKGQNTKKMINEILYTLIDMKHWRNSVALTEMV